MKAVLGQKEFAEEMADSFECKAELLKKKGRSERLVDRVMESVDKYRKEEKTWSDLLDFLQEEHFKCC